MSKQGSRIPGSWFASTSKGSLKVQSLRVWPVLSDDIELCRTTCPKRRRNDQDQGLRKGVRRAPRRSAVEKTCSSACRISETRRRPAALRPAGCGAAAPRLPAARQPAMQAGGISMGPGFHSAAADERTADLEVRRLVNARGWI